MNALSSAIPEEPVTEVRPGGVLGTPELGDGTVWKNSFPEFSLKKSLETISLRGDSSKYKKGSGLEHQIRGQNQKSMLFFCTCSCKHLGSIPLGIHR